MPRIQDPTPAWLKPENASVLDSPLTKALRILAGLIGADDPQSQVLGLMNPLESPERAAITRVADLVERARRDGLYLHGSSAEFNSFRPGGHGAVYLSPSPVAGRKSQAEHIAGGPFGGRLYSVAVDESKLKRFDPLNDPLARQILESAAPNRSMNGWVNYVDMPDVVQAAGRHGYNDFTVWEPSVQGTSRAITDMDALRIIQRALAKE